MCLIYAEEKMESPGFNSHPFNHVFDELKIKFLCHV